MNYMVYMLYNMLFLLCYWMKKTSSEAFFMITTVEGAMILSASLSGAIVLRDVYELPPWRIVFYSLSVMVVIFGAFEGLFKRLFNDSSRFFKGFKGDFMDCEVVFVTECPVSRP